MTSQFNRAARENQKDEITDSDEKEERGESSQRVATNELYFEQQEQDESGAPELLNQSGEEEKDSKF